MPKHFKGGKVSGSHTTVTEPAERVVEAACDLPAVTKVVLGIIKRQASKQARLKFKEIPAGFELTVIGTGTIQTLYIYTQQRESVQTALSEAFYP